jgi:iron complex outermembrane receptor protein
VGGSAFSGAVVTVAGGDQVTGDDGVATFALAAGRWLVEVRAEGFLDAEQEVEVRAGEQRVVPVALEPSGAFEEEVLVVASTRTGRRIEDEPLRVEVLEREEIEEKMLMTPGDIVMMLNEMGGLRVQSTSPAMGAATLRIQGMRGRYTRFFSDGLPLFGEQPGGLGLLQIPPMDLGQVEVIKGVASALYGAGAMGGVVNLLSRRPGDAAAHEVLLNQSGRGATDAVLWLSGPVGEESGATLLAGLHRQSRSDVDGDGWADLPEYLRGVARPRYFWDDGAGTSLFVTTGLTHEQRTGGTLAGALLPATGEPYVEALETTRADAGIFGQKLIAERYVATARFAAVGQWHDHTFGEVRERDRHATMFAEGALRGGGARSTWVVGAALEIDDYDPVDVPRFTYTFTKPGVFGQYDWDALDWLSLSLSGRLDGHSEYGTFLSPRASLLLRYGGFTARGSLGSGFYGPTPLTEETEAAGLTRLVVSEPLRAERGGSASLDVGYERGAVSTHVTVFGSRIEDSVIVEREDQYSLRNLDGSTDNRGVELLVTARRAPFSLTGSYTWVDAIEQERGSERDVPLTPRHSAGVVAMAEDEEWGRVGLELYYTGRQSLEADPYRSVSEPYWILGLLVEKRFGSFSLFVNGENLTGVRQSDHGPVLLPSRAVDGRWTVDAWAPLEGRVVNGGVRVRF